MATLLLAFSQGKSFLPVMPLASLFNSTAIMQPMIWQILLPLSVFLFAVDQILSLVRFLSPCETLAPAFP